MSKQLATAVHLTDEAGVVHSFLPGTNPPKWARDLILNPKAWSDSDDGPTLNDAEPTAAAEEPTDESETSAIPPKSGKGSGVKAWRAYADTVGFETDDDITRDEIIAALEADGIPTE